MSRLCLTKLIAIMLGANALDYISTYIGVSVLGMQDFNPFICFLIANNYFMPIKLLVPVLLGCYIFIRAKKSSEATIKARYLAIIAIIAYSAAGIHNLIQVLLFRLYLF